MAKTEVSPTILTLLVILVLAGGAVLAQMNASALQAPFSMSIPGISATPVTNLGALVAIGGVVVVLWLAGMLDLMILRWHVRKRDALLAAKDLEIVRIKATAYDLEQPALADIRTQLDKVAVDVNTVATRLEAAPRSDRVIREEIRTTKPEREHIAVTE